MHPKTVLARNAYNDREKFVPIYGAVPGKKNERTERMKTFLNTNIERAVSSEGAVSSRRSFLGRTVSGGLMVAALASLPGVIPKAKANVAGDIDVLNYALTLEHLEANFYVEGLERFDNRDFRMSKKIKGLGAKTGDTVREYLYLIRDHEVVHVTTLQQVIQSLGGTPVAPCTYNFGYTNLDQFLAVAQALENTGVMAYDGAIASIESPDLQTAGATIATVEARHASYLNLVNGEVPFPAAFDTPKTMAEILAIASQFIVSCP